MTVALPVSWSYGLQVCAGHCCSWTGVSRAGWTGWLALAIVDGNKTPEDWKSEYTPSSGTNKTKVGGRKRQTIRQLQGVRDNSNRYWCCLRGTRYVFLRTSKQQIEKRRSDLTFVFSGVPFPSFGLLPPRKWFANCSGRSLWPFSKIVQLGISFDETVCQPTVALVGLLAHVDTARNCLFLSGLPVTEDFCTVALTITLNLVYPLLSKSGRKLSKLMTIDRRLIFRVVSSSSARFRLILVVVRDWE